MPLAIGRTADLAVGRSYTIATKSPGKTLLHLVSSFTYLGSRNAHLDICLYLYIIGQSSYG